jgi:hypothetical protein
MRLFKRRAALAISLLGSFVSWPRVAKARKHKFRDVSELRDILIGRLKRLPGVDSVTVVASDPAKIDIKVGDSSWTSDVTNLFQYFRVYPDDDTDAEIDRWLRSVIQARGRVLDDDNLVAVVRSRDYIDEGIRMGMEFMQEPLMGDLAIVYMIDMPDAVSPLLPDEVAGRTLQSLHALAFENVRKWLPKVVADGAAASGMLYYIDGNMTLSPSLILLDEFWASIASDFPGDCLIALPRRDQLFVYNADAVVEAKHMIEITMQDNFSLLSDMLYARRGGKLMRADN